MLIFCGSVTFVKLKKLKPGVILKNPSYCPLASEDKKVVASEVLNPFRIVGELQGLGIESLVCYPSYLLIRKASAP